MRKYLSLLAATALVPAFVACKDTEIDADDDGRRTVISDEGRPGERAALRESDSPRPLTMDEDNRDDADRAELETTGKPNDPERTRVEADVDDDELEVDVERDRTGARASADGIDKDGAGFPVATIGLNPMSKEELKGQTIAQVYSQGDANRVVLRVRNGKPGSYGVFLGERCTDPMKAKDLNAADEEGVGTATILENQKKLGTMRVDGEGNARFEASVPHRTKKAPPQALIVRPEGADLDSGAVCGLLLDADRNAG